jgi:hypothetical protein
MAKHRTRKNKKHSKVYWGGAGPEVLKQMIQGMSGVTLDDENIVKIINGINENCSSMPPVDISSSVAEKPELKTDMSTVVQQPQSEVQKVDLHKEVSGGRRRRHSTKSKKTKKSKKTRKTRKTRHHRKN